MNKVHGPDISWSNGFLAIHTEFRLDAPFGMLVAKLKPQLIVNPASLLHIYPPSPTTQQDMDTAVSVANTRLAYLLYAQLNWGLSGAAGLVMVSRGVELQNLAGPPDRYSPIHQHPVDQLALPDRS